MPAKLIVTAGAGPGARFDIQDEVLRIGSDSKCEFRLRDPGLAAHAATLEYRDGQYFIHNRGSDSIEVNGKALEQRGSTRWAPGAEVNLGHGLTLLLEVEGDPAPAPAAPVYTYEYDPEEPKEDDPSRRKSERPWLAANKQTIQIAVIVASIPLIALMLTMDQWAWTETKAVAPVTFDEVIAELNKNAEDRKRGALSLRATLQRARVAELRGAGGEARQAYEQVRDALLLRRQPDGTFAQPADEKLWHFVAAHLQRLGGSGSFLD